MTHTIRPSQPLQSWTESINENCVKKKKKRWHWLPRRRDSCHQGLSWRRKRWACCFHTPHPALPPVTPTPQTSPTCDTHTFLNPSHTHRCHTHTQMLAINKRHLSSSSLHEAPPSFAECHDCVCWSPPPRPTHLLLITKITFAPCSVFLLNINYTAIR